MARGHDLNLNRFWPCEDVYQAFPVRLTGVCLFGPALLDLPMATGRWPRISPSGRIVTGQTRSSKWLRNTFGARDPRICSGKSRLGKREKIGLNQKRGLPECHFPRVSVELDRRPTSTRSYMTTRTISTNAPSSRKSKKVTQNRGKTSSSSSTNGIMTSKLYVVTAMRLHLVTHRPQNNAMFQTWASLLYLPWYLRRKLLIV